MAKVSVIGAGSWGTALAMLLAGNGHDTILWSHREEQAEELSKTREHKAKLPGVILPKELKITSNLEQAQRRGMFWCWQFLPLLYGRLLKN